MKILDKSFGNNEKSLNYAKRKKFFRKKDAPTSKQNVTCYECGKQGHIKKDCPKFTKKSGLKNRKETKSKRAYIAREDNEINSSSESKSEECEKISLMASHYSDDENEEVSNDFFLYDNDAQGAIDELLDECKFMYKTMSTQNKQILYLEEKIDTMEKDFEIEK